MHIGAYPNYFTRKLTCYKSTATVICLLSVPALAEMLYMSGFVLILPVLCHAINRVSPHWLLVLFRTNHQVISVCGSIHHPWIMISIREDAMKHLLFPLKKKKKKKKNKALHN